MATLNKHRLSLPHLFSTSCNVRFSYPQQRGGMGRFQRVVPPPSVMIRQCTCVLARSRPPRLLLPHLPRLPPQHHPTHPTGTREATSRNTEAMGRTLRPHRAPATTQPLPTARPHPRLRQRYPTLTLNMAPPLKLSTTDGTRTQGARRPSRLYRQATTRATTAPRNNRRPNALWRTLSCPLPSSPRIRLRHGLGRRALRMLLRFRPT